MTTPPQPTKVVDEGNTFLAETPSHLMTAIADTPAGQRLAMTIRTTSTTLTVLLNAADAKTWATALTTGARQMSQSGLVVATRPAATPGTGPA